MRLTSDTAAGWEVAQRARVMCPVHMLKEPSVDPQNAHKSQVCWYMPVTTAVGEQRQADPRGLPV